MNIRAAIDQENIANWRLGDVLQNRADGRTYLFLGSVDDKKSALYMIELNEKHDIEYGSLMFAMPTEWRYGVKCIRGLACIGRN